MSAAAGAGAALSRRPSHHQYLFAAGCAAYRPHPRAGRVSIRRERGGALGRQRPRGQWAGHPAGGVMSLTRRQFISAALAMAATAALPVLSSPARTPQGGRAARPAAGGLRIVGDANRVMLG
ncbi:twin-arginine translocation signal domain-containing protein [Salinicola endophyticus]|uniref:Twin-arginine translocation signal domain-containing protein n=2 Tax=Halomonadaceae TaxID=28256 RepID=A0ABY8FMT8_9GAMM|nr:twin-arginine translocation signal domain-containing protein [Salinicola endophyticus]